MNHTGCHQLSRVLTRVVTPGVRLVTWTMMAVMSSTGVLTAKPRGEECQPCRLAADGGSLERVRVRVQLVVEALDDERRGPVAARAAAAEA
jgi:hypothetical protein